MGVVAEVDTGPSRVGERPPRDGLWRLWVPGEGDGQGIELRDSGDGGSPKLTGHFAVFNRWTEIDSIFEGTFMERIAPGAFKKTMREQRDQMRVLLNHGKDPSLGMQALGSISSLREDDVGAAYEVNLFRGVPELVVEGLRANQYGASFKFRVTREEILTDRKPTRDNPKGMDQRTIQEAQVFEFGPVTFPAYQEATAGLRSVTDEYLFSDLTGADPELIRMAGRGMNLDALIARRVGISVPRSVEEKPAEKAEEKSAETSERMDSEDLGTLACMLSAGAQYIEDQDEPNEQPNIAKMEAILASIQELTTFEASENEPDEAEDEENSSEIVGEERDGKENTAETEGEESKETPVNRSNEGTKETAVPEPRSTPLVGPAGFREPWRL